MEKSPNKEKISSEDQSSNSVSARQVSENKSNWRSLPRKRKRRITQKQALYVSALLDGASQSDAVKQAGYNTAHTHSMSSQLLSNETIISTIVSSIRDGRYDSLAERTWMECLNDEGSRSLKVSERNDTHRTKMKAIEMIAKIGGLIAPTKTEHRTLSVDLSSLLPTRTIAK